jgi:hypothetical protein
MITSHPLGVMSVTYVSSTGHTGKYWVWKSGYMWLWEALGNGGVEMTEEEAKEAARRWIGHIK